MLANKANTDDLDGKLDKTAIVTSVSSTSTDAQVPTAKAVHTAIQNVSGGVSTEQLEQAIQEAKTELENEITNIPKVTKTSELTNDSGFITEVDLEPYALKTQIPTTLPASDVYDWAKEATKPTYTASEVGALASNGTATNASKVANALTLQVNGVTNLTYDGSVARTFNLANASTSISGVMTPAMVTKLDGIETGATKTTVTNNLTSTSTTSALSAYQGKVLNDELQSLKTTSVNGKTSVANAINGKLGTTLSNQTSFADMAYYINTIPSMGSVGSLPSSSKFIQINLPVTREVLGGNTLAKGKTVTIDGGLIMFVCDDDRESLKITPISSAIKVYGRDDSGAITVNAGTSFSTDGYEWFIVNPSRTQLSCIRVGISDADKWNPEINISIS